MVGDGAAGPRACSPAGAARAAFDLVILDVMLPGLDGFEVAERMRKAGDYTPDPDAHRQGPARGRGAGPRGRRRRLSAEAFDLTVLLARVKGLLRRRDWARGDGGRAAAAARIGDADVDFAHFEIAGAGRTVRLTLLEAMLLKLLVQNAGRVVSKAEILEKVWNVSPDTETRAVDNFIVRLRRYLETDPRVRSTSRRCGARATGSSWTPTRPRGGASRRSRGG